MGALFCGAESACYFGHKQLLKHGNDRKPPAPRRQRRRQRKRSLGDSRRPRRRNVLLLSVFQEISRNRKRQQKKLKLVGRKRVRRSFEGWTRVNVQPKLSTCGGRQRPHRASHGGQPLVLLVRVTDVDGSATSDVTQLIGVPIQCHHTTPLDEDDKLDTAMSDLSADGRGTLNSTLLLDRSPYLELTLSASTTTDDQQQQQQQHGTARRRHGHTQHGRSQRRRSHVDD